MLTAQPTVPIIAAGNTWLDLQQLEAAMRAGLLECAARRCHDLRRHHADPQGHGRWPKPTA